MAKKYCKKSSLTSVAEEVRTRNGTSAQIPFANIATTISNLAIPAQRGAPSTVLTASNPSTTIQRGKYTGGSVSLFRRMQPQRSRKTAAMCRLKAAKRLRLLLSLRKTRQRLYMEMLRQATVKHQYPSRG